MLENVSVKTDQMQCHHQEGDQQPKYKQKKAVNESKIAKV